MPERSYQFVIYYLQGLINQYIANYIQPNGKPESS